MWKRQWTFPLREGQKFPWLAKEQSATQQLCFMNLFSTLVSRRHITTKTWCNFFFLTMHATCPNHFSYLSLSTSWHSVNIKYYWACYYTSASFNNVTTKHYCPLRCDTTYFVMLVPVETGGTSETLIPLHQTTRRHDSLHRHYHDTLCSQWFAVSTEVSVCVPIMCSQCRTGPSRVGNFACHVTDMLLGFIHVACSFTFVGGFATSVCVCLSAWSWY